MRVVSSAAYKLMCNKQIKSTYKEIKQTVYKLAVFKFGKNIDFLYLTVYYFVIKK